MNVGAQFHQSKLQHQRNFTDINNNKEGLDGLIKNLAHQLIMNTAKNDKHSPISSHAPISLVKKPGKLLSPLQ